MPLGAHSASEDIEIDIDSLDVDTLRRLQDYVKVRLHACRLMMRSCQLIRPYDVQSSAPKPKRVAPAAPVKTKADLLKAVTQDSEANKQRMLAIEKANAAPPPAPQQMARPPPAATRPVGGFGSDSDSGKRLFLDILNQFFTFECGLLADSDGDAPPPPPPRF